MSVMTQSPSGTDLSDQSGKSLLFWIIHEQNRHVHSKECLSVVTDDSTIYRWSRFSDDEPFTFDCRIKPNGRRDGSRRQLPGVVETVVDELDDKVIY